MRPLIVGIGRAGCRIANSFLKRESSKVRYSGVLLDTDRAHLKYFEEKYRLLLGESIVDGNGTGMDLELGRRIMAEEAWRIVEALDSVKEDMDCLLVTSSFGGGTGGSASVLVEELKRSYSEPVYHLGVLPGEEDAAECFTNFARSFRPAVAKSDAVFPVDNDALRGKLRLRGQLNYINKKIFGYLDSIFRVGEYSAPQELGSNVLTASDVINTLKGISTLGVGRRRIESTDEKLEKPEMVVELTEKAVSSLLAPVDFKSSRSALIVVSGPRNYLDFLGSIPSRLWMEKNIDGVEVRGGDLPGERSHIEVATLLSGLRKSEKLKNLYKIGENMGGERAEPSSELKEKLELLQRKVEELRGLSRQLGEDMAK